MPLVDRLRRGRRDPEPGPAAENEKARLEDLVIITGFSGAGKSTAMAVFEDHGYFCVDNLPPEMIRPLAELFMHEGSKVERAAVVCDVRGGEFFGELAGVLDSLTQWGARPRLCFLEANEQTLLTRYKETRRRHPLAPDGAVLTGVDAERALLAPLRERAELIVQTQGLKPADLRHKIADEMLPQRHEGRLAVTFQSFGFKNGPARDADLLFDCRFLPNPHYEAELRPLTGHDAAVVEYANRGGALDEFVDRVGGLLDYLLPHYVEEGKSHLVVSVGCTGGRHRSVAIIECLGARYADDEDLNIAVAHRDLDGRR